MSWSGCTARGWACDGHDPDDIYRHHRGGAHRTDPDVHEMKKSLKSLKKNSFIRARTSEKVDKDGKKILMVEEIDEPDYRSGDFRDEIMRMNKIRKR
jgi:hypothetical protein